MDNEAQILLDDTIAFCRRDGQEERLINMLAQSKPLDLTDDELTIEAPSRFAVAHLNRCRPTVEGYLEQITFAALRLNVLPPEGQTMPPTPVSDTSAAIENGGSFLPSAKLPPLALNMTKKGNGVRVKSTLTRDEYLRLVAEETGGYQPRPAHLRPEVPVPAEQDDNPFPRVGVTSKFTFDTFVYGEENKHAYHSAQRFAAFADEPDPYGKCSRFFVYGKSGLGKTHLLLAIKNFLAENKPQLKVKYANSQAYIDDFINEIAHQKGEGRSILREYHEADVLIIDDIQNIIGKQASIEYFFSLLDEFMRNGKKIAIASDRAPKDLGVDTRLSSRLSPNMLCLVSEPGYEMKYAILKRYYETVIAGDEELAPTADGSLLQSFDGHNGTITDEQLRHMAEISGNNIRELESFCERIASQAFDREKDGGELLAEDIDRIASEYFDTAHKVIAIGTVQTVVEEFYHVSHEDLIGPKRSRDIAFARHVAIYLANSLCELSSKAIGEQFGGRDHSTVINSLKVVEKKMRDDRHVCDDLQKLKGKITMRA